MKTSEECAVKELTFLQRTGYPKRTDETQKRTGQRSDPLPQFLGICLRGLRLLRAKNRY